MNTTSGQVRKALDQCGAQVPRSRRCRGESSARSGGSGRKAPLSNLNLIATNFSQYLQFAQSAAV
jgi:hypothetical protein